MFGRHIGRYEPALNTIQSIYSKIIKLRSSTIKHVEQFSIIKQRDQTNRTDERPKSTRVSNSVFRSNFGVLTNGWSFRQAFLSSDKRPRAIPDILEV